ncbi:hypothetical protein [Mycolicibacterium brumae]|uniref:Uncharacterized protein n=1 Tax=Mycolicibacterium brumae TaxID=85968 RepID=A0A2G5PD43_9MYCO|nr:hypothetical protein [Mycolicibacterium brumae]MCV7191873.1 hypothetical protein [Mycolicibacterium brumae]PIB76251.1 hypothetical protein CQY22_005880 [Mycolicibacterium brumae]RWA15748.1 hypothetical protein MBRU_09355 [Mycolicibacterium brumae DSM 44177]UWW07179.1 hypothetical protein L2Z93_000173 [Mycolicibacterium brumae]
MSRRVIFPDPQIWTRKENTMTNPDHVQPRDIRLAAVLIKHHLTSNTAGQVEVIRETVDTDRATALLAAVLDLHAQFVTQTRNQVGLDFFAEGIHALGEFDPVDEIGQDLLNAIAVVEGHGTGDIAAINEVLTKVRAQGRGTQLMINILDVFDHALPELSSHAGIRWLDATVAEILSSGRETGQ